MKKSLSLFLILLISCSTCLSSKLSIEKNIPENKISLNNKSKANINEYDVMIFNSHDYKTSNTSFVKATEEDNDSGENSINLVQKKEVSKRIIPDNPEVFNKYHNLENVYQTYDMPTKIWYYNQNTYVYAGRYNSIEFSNALNKKIIIPYEMYELDIEIPFNTQMYRYNTSTIGYEIELLFDDMIIDTIYFSHTTKNSSWMYFRHIMHGTVFKILAGEHTITLRIRCLDTGYYCYIYNFENKNYLMMKGYPIL